MSGMEEELRQLAELVRTRNEIDHQISHLLGRPATVGNIGEFVTSRVFDIKLSSSGPRRAMTACSPVVRLWANG